jgi:glycosyltransferase involved in cell wall biosynthesis
MHRLAVELQPRHRIQVVTQWDNHRTDWLLGTTLRAPAPAKDYTVDGVPVRRITLDERVRRRLTPWVLGYYVVQGPALRRIGQALAAELQPFAEQVELIHNCRIGREGLTEASLQVARARDVPFLLTPVHHPRWGSWLHRHYHRLYRTADAVIALTETERRTLMALGVAEQRVHITGMGPILADKANEVRFRDQHGLGQAPIILFLGQKYAYKGLAALLDAARIVWQRVPEACFVFVGPRTRYSRRLFSSVSDRRVLELDQVDLQSKTDALAACAMLCVPSTQESFGGVYTEAWSLGKPVIAADTPVSREVIADGGDGCLVPPVPEPIADRIVQFLRDTALAQRLGANGKAKVKARFSWPRLAALTEAIYRQVVG